MSAIDSCGRMPRALAACLGLVLAAGVHAQEVIVPAQPQPQAQQVTPPKPEPAAPQQDAAPQDPPTETTVPPQDTPPQTPQAPPPDPAETALWRMDRDGDGRVSPVEHASDASAQFDDMDADNNYHVSAEEMEGGSGASTASNANGAMGAAPDPNNNGEISKSEAEANAERDFQARDANRDGTLDVEELKSKN